MVRGLEWKQRVQGRERERGLVREGEGRVSREVCHDNVRIEVFF